MRSSGGAPGPGTGESPDRSRRALGRAGIGRYGLAVVIGEVVFVAVPWGLVELNGALGWPRWQTSAGRALGPALVLGALALAAYCSALFSRVGLGRPFLVDPPRRLVVTGPYRRSRNPIYAAEIAILLGFFLHRGELSLLLYAGVFAVAIHLWVVRVEEPALRRRFGDEYVRYARVVPRWLAGGGGVTPAAG